MPGVSEKRVDAMAASTVDTYFAPAGRDDQATLDSVAAKLDRTGATLA